MDANLVRDKFQTSTVYAEHGSLVLERWRPSKQIHPSAVVSTTPKVGDVLTAKSDKTWDLSDGTLASEVFFVEERFRASLEAEETPDVAPKATSFSL